MFTTRRARRLSVSVHCSACLVAILLHTHTHDVRHSMAYDSCSCLCSGVQDGALCQIGPWVCFLSQTTPVLCVTERMYILTGGIVDFELVDKEQPIEEEYKAAWENVSPDSRVAIVISDEISIEQCQNFKQVLSRCCNFCIVEGYASGQLSADDLASPGQDMLLITTRGVLVDEGTVAEPEVALAPPKSKVAAAIDVGVSATSTVIGATATRAAGWIKRCTNATCTLPLTSNTIYHNSSIEAPGVYTLLQVLT
eukprot:m.107176 g.107176  ORF g.107176 m.107176 type:complete len:253 (-) comp13320_c0_seq5:906-1664(-)